MTTLVIDESSLRAVRAEVTEEALAVDLADGRSVSVPLGRYPRLLQASVEEKRQLRLIGSGEGIHWGLLDEDISVEGIVAGRPSMESAESFRHWLQNRKRARFGEVVIGRRLLDRGNATGCQPQGVLIPSPAKA